MKHVLCLGLMFALVSASKADILLYDDFSYPDGNIVVTSGNVWTNHSGTQNDSMVSGGKYQINYTHTDDISRAFNPPNSSSLLYASFTLNMSTLPSSSGGYFAHFKDDGTFNFLARLYALTAGTVAPGTYRLGIANVAGVATNVYPVDLATNVDYRVVLSYDIVNMATTLYVDPVTSADANVGASDAVTGTAATAILSAFAFRQAAGEGIMTVDDLLVGNTFEEVVTNAPKAPGIAVQPQGASLYAGNDLTLYCVGFGSGQLTYQWRKNGANLYDSGNVLGANSSVLQLTGVSGLDDGSYDVVITSNYGSTNSQPALVSVNTASTAPIITGQPKSVTNSVGSTATFTVTATGTAPLNYQWSLYGTNLPGSTGSTLTLTTISNGNAGPYICTVGNAYGNRPSDTAWLAVLPPLATNIAYLRTLLDPVTFLPTNTTSLYQVDGVVTTFTNITTAANAQFYIQDDTAGIVVFVNGAATLRPQAGDRVRVVGPLGHYNSVLELNLAASNPMHSVTTLSSGNQMPAAKPFFFAQTNDLVAMEQQVEGSLVTVTNVYFPTGGGSATFSANANLIVTNALGQTFAFRIDSRCTNFNGVPMPAFAYQVTGVMGQFLGATATPRNNGYQLMLTRPADVVATLPDAPTVSISPALQGPSISWPNSLGSTYSVYAAENLAGPFNRVAFGLNFFGTAGRYTQTNSANARFFRISTP